MSATNSLTVSKTNSSGFIEAVKANDVNKVRRYIKAGLDIAKSYKRNDENPLYFAILANSAEMVRTLLEGGAIVNTITEIDTLLYEAVGTENTKIVEMMLQAGADPNMPSLSRETPLFKAVELSSVKMVQLLCENNANPNLKDLDGRTPKAIAKSERVRKALETCVATRKDGSFSAQQILNQIRHSIQTKGTFVIQSQKTGQCFSDSFQHVMYFADGIAPYFIQRAIDRSKESLRLPVKRENFAEKMTPSKAVTLYLDYTGIRFLDMFMRPLLLSAPQKGQVVRRPSIVSINTEEPMGIVCSQALNIYRVIQDIYKEDRERRQGIEEKNENFKIRMAHEREMKEFNYPHTLNEEGFGYLLDSTEYLFWDDVLNRIPGSMGNAEIRGETDSISMKKYRMTILTKKNETYSLPLDSVVGILFSVFPLGHVVRDFSAGHALSMVKVFGKWYICDDNVGFALPVKDFSMEKLIYGQFTMKFKETSVEYSIFDKFRLNELVAQGKRDLGRDFFEDFVNPPESEYIYPLAEVKLTSRTTEKTFQESDPGGDGGFMDYSFSRKYICWQA